MVRRVQDRHEAPIRAGDVDKDVALEEAGDVNDAVGPRGWSVYGA